MLILFKQSIKTTFLLLLFMATGNFLNAGNFFLPKDTITQELIEMTKIEIPENEIFLIPARLAMLPINFRINSSISYFSINHFVVHEAKKVFFQAWLKEQELEKLSFLTDSLRKTYLNASEVQKQEISSQILSAEEKSIALHEEIPVLYEKAREEEDLFWQTSSPYAIMRFQEKISLFKDSIARMASVQTMQEATTQAKIPDTINLYKSVPQTEKIPAVVKGDIIYKIQIGAFKGKIPESANKQIKNISIIRKVENHVDEKGVKVYTTGNLRVYSEAITMLGQVKQEGIKNAVITAYQNGKTISVNEARKLNNE
jgi:hypothetical protein